MKFYLSYIIIRENYKVTKLHQYLERDKTKIQNR